MRRIVVLAGLITAMTSAGFWAQDLSVPNRADSLKFAAIGDNGTGEQLEYDIGRQMGVWRRRFPFDMVIMLGDNIYGSQRPADFVQKFEKPFKSLLDNGVKFYASLGNHDNRANDAYAPFNMGGQRYYTFARNNARFFALDTNFLDAAQLNWIEHALKETTEPWKIAYFHHPVYSDGGRHGSEVDLRVRLEPLFTKYGVKVVYSGHDHIYERLKPQNGITYFVSGAGGQLRQGDLRRSSLTAAGFDQDCSFMLNEIAGDDLFFQVVSRTGQTVDAGVIHREAEP
ncbi:MAG TPA: metallophosphoesterase [Vicinamibacterales bacterium]|nr:metallophosphoesterase [Vicinamibacterales bacterium]